MTDASQKGDPQATAPKPPPRLPQPKAADTPPGAPPPLHPNVKPRAPGVRSATEAPAEPTTLRTGDTVGGAFVVQRYLGSSGAAISYLCTDKARGEPVVIKVLSRAYPGDEVFEGYRAQVKVASAIRQRNLARILGMGTTGQNEMFVAMEYVAGSTVSRLVAQLREGGEHLELRDVFTILAHVCDALSAIHQHTAHGVLTPYNIYLDKQGVVKLGNLTFDRIAGEYMASELGSGPFVDSIYVAPEVAEDPTTITPAADLYSLGMLAAELLSETGLPDQRKRARHLALDGMSKYPPSLVNLIASCIDSVPENRPPSAKAFRDTFEDAAREAGARLGGAPPPGCLPIEPAVADDSGTGLGDQDSDLFNIELPGFASGAGQSEERYLLQKNGLDYGPFSREQVLEQLYADEVNEFSLVLDRTTQDRLELGEMVEFKEDVAAYIPRREERRRLEALARAELERKVKQGASIGLKIAVVVGVVILTVLVVFRLQQPAPQALPLENAFASLDFKFLPPPREFQTIAVDKDLIASIFNLNASQDEIARKVKRHATKKGVGSRAPTKPGESNVAEIDLASDSGSNHFLSDSEIYEIILSQFGDLRGCIMQELRDNRGFKGVTVQFFIRPSGTTGGVTIKESQYADRPVGVCLKQRFRAMSFPEHNAISNKGVTFPLMVQ